MIKANSSFSKGIVLVNVLVFAVIAIAVTTALINWGVALLKSNRELDSREQAFQIAEAGIDYYRWHLAHAQSDYTDGNGATTTGPFVHDFKDKDGNVIGQFALTITPPLIGSTVVKIRSQGTVANNPAVSRAIQVTVAIPSIAKYNFVTNSVVYYGGGDEIFGQIHSNAGVGFWNGTPKPVAHNIVTSAVPTITDVAASSSCPGAHFGVYTCVPPNAETYASAGVVPATPPNRVDVFQSGRQFPVPAVDFTSITSDLSSIKAAAQASGFYRTGSGGLGYKLVLKTNGTFDLYKVNSLLPAPSGCTNSQTQTGWGTWSIGTIGSATTLLGNYAYPSNGLMFFQDHLWVEGQVNNARLTIVTGIFPTNILTNTNIIINNNLTYTNFDGRDAIGLIAQGNFLIGMASADNLTIDGAVIAQNGQAIRYYYAPNCKNGSDLWGVRNSLTTYGMFASNGQAYFSYGSSGYTHQPSSYDTNLLYAPPPNFPLTSDQYTTISWDEVK